MATYVAAGTPAATTATLPAGTAVGDYVCVCAYRGANATLPTLPANWIVATQLASNPAHLVAYREYDGVWTMPTFTNAQRCVSFTVRPASGMDCKPGAVRSDAFSATNVSWPALTLQVTDGSSVVVRGVCHTRNDSAFPVPTGHTQIDNNGTQPGYGTFRKNSSTDAAAATSAISRSTTYTTFTVEVRDVPLPKTGTAAVTHSWTPTATGKETPKGAAVVSHGWTSTATGVAPSTGPPPTIPTAGLAGWWDADDAATITASAGTISVWGDKSGANRHLSTTAGTPKTGIATQNSRNVVSLTAGSDQLRHDAGSTTINMMPWTLFVVVNPTDQEGRFINALDTPTSYDFAAGSGLICYPNDGTLNIYQGGLAIPGGVPFTTNVWQVWRTSAINGGDWTAVVNGVASAWGRTGNLGMVQVLNLGNGYGPGIRCHVGEIIIYSRALTAPEITQVEGYLNTKWFVAKGPPPKTGTATVSWKADPLASGVAPTTAQWITSVDLNVPNRGPRGDFYPFIGGTIQVGSQPIVVTHIGRWTTAAGTNNRDHNLKIVTASTGVDLPGSAVVVNPLGTPVNQFLYGELAAPVTMLANTQYHIVGDNWPTETDMWLNAAGSYPHTDVADLVGDVLSLGGTSWLQQGQNTMFGPLDFKYLTSGGTAPPKTGTAAVSWSESTTAAGKRTPVAQATTVLTWPVTVAAGKRAPKASATVAHTWVPDAAGKRIPKATAAVTWTEALTSAGKRSPLASAAVIHTWVQTATGLKPIVGAKQGTAAAVWNITSSAKGEKGRESWATISHSWTMIAQGVSPIVGVNQGTALVTWKMATTGGSPTTPPLGGVISVVGGNRIHTFATGDEFALDGSSSITVDVLVVGGGGSGGRSPGATSGGGGGGGAVLTGQFVVSASQTITVGAGAISPTTGSRNGINGGNSSFGALLTALGGGGGGGTATTPSGGSGGGAYNNPTAGSGIAAGGLGTPPGGNNGGLGNDGTAPVVNRRGGGGGGAGAVGTSGRSGAAPHGGAGISNDYSGTPTFYGGGGGGGASQAPVGNGGVGGGGPGSIGAVTPAAATPNTGGGGGGTYSTTALAGAGGSGLVIVRYPVAVIGGGDPNGGWAIGKSTPKSNVTTDWLETQTATGQKILSGTVATTYTMATAAQGKQTPKATAATTYTETLTVTGKKVTKGQAAATHTWTTVAQGVKPVIGVNQGSALVLTSWKPTAGGKRVPKSSAAVVHTWIPTAAGSKPLRGSAVVTHLWQPSAAGKRVPQGVATASHIWISTAIGRRSLTGTSTLKFLFSTAAVGTSDLGLGQIVWNGKAVLEMQYGDQPVQDWFMVPT